MMKQAFLRRKYVTASDTTECAVMSIKDWQDAFWCKICWSRTEFSCLIWFCQWIWFLVKTVCSRRVKEDWFGFDHLQTLSLMCFFFDMLLSHCSAHILLTVYSDRQLYTRTITSSIRTLLPTIALFTDFAWN